MRLDKMEGKYIKGFERYIIYVNGEVFDTLKMRYLKQSISGYLRVKLCRGCERYSKYVHRLVAEAFIPNLENKDEVNHIDGNKKNNHISNLEWVTHVENMKHAHIKGLLKKPKGEAHGNYNKLSKQSNHYKSVNQYSLDNNFIKTWDCMADVQRVLGIKSTNISANCLDKIKTCGGFYWRFA